MGCARDLRPASSARAKSRWLPGSAAFRSSGRRTVLTDRQHTGPVYPNRQLVTRLLKGRCELCQRTDNITVHHVRALAGLNRPGQPQPERAKFMAKIRRKSLVVCSDCHDLIHGHPATPLTQ
jgi:AI2M/AI1M-like, HNH endonuclease